MVNLSLRISPTPNEFETALRVRPGSAYVSLTDALIDALKPSDYTTAEERPNKRLISIQILVPVEDSEGRLVGVLVANVLTHELLLALARSKTPSSRRRLSLPAG